MRENEKMRDRFIRECLGVSVADLSYYDAVFNNERQGLDEIAGAIFTCVNGSWQRKGRTRQAALTD